MLVGGGTAQVVDGHVVCGPDHAHLTCGFCPALPALWCCRAPPHPAVPDLHCRPIPALPAVAVNPNDTEESIWAFLCEAQMVGADAARQQFLQVGLAGQARRHAAKGWAGLC